jgi:hypothetical protein
MIILQIFAPLWSHNMIGVGAQYAYTSLCVIAYAVMVFLSIFWCPYYHGLGNWGSLSAMLIVWFGSIISLFTSNSLVIVYDSHIVAIFNTSARSDIPIYVWLGMIAVALVMGLLAK